jgi:glycerol-3-phosphate O-acyltransferase
MKSPWTAGALALALTLCPACASLRTPDLPNPIAAAKTDDQRALAAIESYAALLQEATDLIRDPATPVAVKQALGAAERTATPAMDVLRIAFAQYLRAKADAAAAGLSDRAALERASAILAIAAVRLDEALRQARGPASQLAALINQERRP